MFGIVCLLRSVIYVVLMLFGIVCLDGVCLLDGVGGYTCDCHEFTGPNCEIGKSTYYRLSIYAIYMKL